MTNHIDITIGHSYGSHIRFRLALPPSDDGGISTVLDVRDGAFFGSFNTYLFKGELDRLTQQLRSLYQNLEGVAQFNAAEGAITFVLKGNGRGNFTIQGRATDDNALRRSLAFDFAIDQTFLPSVIKALEALNTPLED